MFAQAHRSIRLDVTSGLSRNLTERYRNGELDIIIVKNQPLVLIVMHLFQKKWRGLK